MPFKSHLRYYQTGCWSQLVDPIVSASAFSLETSNSPNSYSRIPVYGPPSFHTYSRPKYEVQATRNNFCEYYKDIFSKWQICEAQIDLGVWIIPPASTFTLAFKPIDYGEGFSGKKKIPTGDGEKQGTILIKSSLKPYHQATHIEEWPRDWAEGNHKPIVQFQFPYPEPFATFPYPEVSGAIHPLTD